MSLLSIALRNLLMRKLQTFITILVVAVGVAMSLSVLVLSKGVQDGIGDASDPYGMLVGSKGSANQLVFNTIYLMDNPLSNLPLSYFESLKKDERIQSAVPFALGDNYQGFRMVGTDEGFFELRAKPKEPPYFQLAEGRVFKEPFEAVLGSRTAEETGLRIGDEFRSSHGVVQAVEEDGSHAKNPYTVVGILADKGVPADKGIYVNMASYWISHDQLEVLDEHAEDEHAEEAVAEGDGHAHEDEPGVTAVLVKPDSYMNLMKLYQEINNGVEAQAVFPGQVLAKVFDMLGTGEDALKAISYVILGLAGLTVVLSLIGSNLERRRQVAIMRTIGASRLSVFAIVVLESFWIVLIGIALGFAGGYALSAAIAAAVMNQSTFIVRIAFDPGHLWIVPIVSGIGIAAGLLPALNAFRIEVAKHLNPS